MKKILISITARPSYSRIKSAIIALIKNPEVEVSVLASGSSLLERYGRVVDLIREDGIDIEDELYTFVEGNEPVNMALTTASTIDAVARVISRLSPDMVVTIADRYETLGVAIAASYCGIPLVHIQGGEVTGNIDERVRHAVTKLSDLHLVANDNAADRLRRMGESESTIHVTGCPSLDIVDAAKKISVEEIQRTIEERGVGVALDVSCPFVILMQHPETESFEKSYERMLMTLGAVNKKNIPVLIFWPNVDAGSDATSKAIRYMRERSSLRNFRLIKNLEGSVFLKLLTLSKCLIGNSSAGIRECSILGVPVVNIGSRQCGRERGDNVVDVDWSSDLIFKALDRQANASHFTPNFIYGDGLAGERIADLLAKPLNFPAKRFKD
jgi:bifunctional UDP-N-acetylglucosamine 2-epimerase / N-acetylmannosamine kinase